MIKNSLGDAFTLENMKDDIKIRKVAQKDIEKLINLYHELLPWDNLNFEKSKKILGEIIEDEQYSIFVLEKNYQMIATCTLVIIKNLTHVGHPYGILENVVTTVECRGQGYGEALLKWMIEYARINQCHKLMVQTRRKDNYVTHFYNKCGFSSEQCKGFILSFEEMGK